MKVLTSVLSSMKIETLPSRRHAPARRVHLDLRMRHRRHLRVAGC